MPTRIASLLPAATQILCALGRADLIVGVSHECSFPPEIAGRPVLTGPRQEVEDASAHLGGPPDRLVPAALSIYAIEEDALRGVHPDLIVTRDRSEDRGIPPADLKRAVCDWLGLSVDVLLLRAVCLAEVFGDMERLARATRCEFQGQALVTEMRERLEEIRKRAERVRSHPRVACIESIEPLKVAGNWIPELVELCGGTYGLVRPGEPARAIDWTELIADRPEVVILMPLGLTLKQTRRQRSRLTDRPEWRQMPAVLNKRVYSADGSAYLHHAAPRLADGASLLAGLIQPSFFASRIPVGSYELVR